MGQRVRALVRKPAEAAKLDGSEIEVAAGDFDLPETLDAALQGVEKAFLLTPSRNALFNGRKTLSKLRSAPR
jgi:uncharacterized protein YbjT (DUF2867 family)